MAAAAWYESSYRRCLVDMHIEDWDPRFLARFDPAAYVGLMKSAGVQTVMFYANSCVGLCNWPTTSARMHRGLGGRDAVGEVTRRCHAEGMSVVLYYSVVFNNWAYDHDPSWRIIAAGGRPSREAPAEKDAYGLRYGLCCPNTGYRDFAVEQVRELCRGYEFEGIFYDMTFWPAVCYCPSCRARFARELGGEMPRVIDWEDPGWRAFQRKREEWISEFTELLTTTVKEMRPGATVEHQLSSIRAPWRYGITERVLGCSDYCGGDFYGGFLEHSFIAKLYHNATSRLPFEIHTSRCHGGLNDHTSTKPRETLETNACLYLAHRGAFLVIDAIDPAGTLDPRAYEVVRAVFEATRRYEEHLGGSLCQDVGIYFSLASKRDPAETGRSVTDYTFDYPHLVSALGAARALKQHHVPFGVICRRNLGDLRRHRVIVLPNVLEMDEEEVGAFRRFLADGGGIYASGYTARTELARVLGIVCGGETREAITYLAPTSRGVDLLPGVSAAYPLTLNCRQMLLETRDPDAVLATTTLPYTDPADLSRFASIHSNPPGVPTDHPALLRLRHGKGTALWAAGAIECGDPPRHRSIFVGMVRSLAGRSFSFEADAPAAVEITLFHQPDRKRFILNLVNEQEEAPPIPVSGARVRVRTEGRGKCRAVLLPDETPLASRQIEGCTEIDIPTLEIFRMVALNYDHEP